MSGAAANRAFKVASGLAALAGLAGIVVLSAYQGFGAIGRVLLSAGWGIAVVTAFHAVPLAASALAWRAATGAVWRGPAAVFLWARLVREAVNCLLPVTQLGGDVVGARILTFHGGRAHVAGAAVLVDLTLEFLTQIAFTVMGLGLLLYSGGGDPKVMDWAILGLAMAVPAAIGFLLAQRWGMFKLLERLLERIALRFGWPALGSLANLHETIMAIYRERRAIGTATLCHLAAWILGAVEVWLTLLFLGAKTSFAEAFIIESLGQAVRSAAFLVPGALGVQEGAYMLLGMLFGLGPETALSVSLIKRVRELALGVPAMLVWQVIEGRRLLDALNGTRSNGA